MDAPPQLEPGPEDFAFLEYQRQWEGDRRARFRVGQKSRRIGWTWATALEAVLVAGARDGGNVKYTSYNLKFTAEFIDTCAWWAEKLDIGFKVEGDRGAFIRDRKDKLTYTLRLASGWSIQGVSSNPANLRGGSNDVLAVIDEAAHCKSLEGLLKAAAAFTVWGGRVIVISTHNGADNAFAKLCDDIKSGKKKAKEPVVVDRVDRPAGLPRRYAEEWHADACTIYRSGPYALHTCDIHRAVDDGLYRRICHVTGEEWSEQAEAEWLADLLLTQGADEELRVIPDQSGGAYLERALIEASQDPAIPVIRLNAKKLPVFEVPADAGPAELDAWALRRAAWTREWCEEHLAELLRALPRRPHFFAADFGRHMDLSVFIAATREQDMTLRAPFVLELRDVPHEQQRQIAHYVISGGFEVSRGRWEYPHGHRGLPGFSGAAIDRGGPGSDLAESLRYRYGERVLSINLTRQWYGAEFPPLKAMMTKGKLPVPEDSDVLDDLRAVKVIDGTPRVPEKRSRSKNAEDKGGYRHGDTAIALVLLTHASRVLDAVVITGSSIVTPGRSGGAAPRDPLDKKPADRPAASRGRGRRRGDGVWL